MKKPERVEAGQWWRESDEPDERPVRIVALEDASPLNNAGPWAIYTNGAVPQESLLYSGEYLGSDYHPEPSEWMIETLVDAMSEIENGGPAFDEPARGRFDRTNYRQIVRDAIAGKSHDLTYTRCVGVIYRLLRSLGKW